MKNLLGEGHAITEETSSQEESNGSNQEELVAADFHDEEIPINEQLYDQLTKSWQRRESLEIEIPMEIRDETPMNEQLDDQLRTSWKRNESLEIEIPQENFEEIGGSGISHHGQENTPLSANTICNERDIQAEKTDTERPLDPVETLETSNNIKGN